MARYIDAEKRLAELKEKEEFKEIGWREFASMEYALEYAPTADVVEVRHGKWEQPNWIARQLKFYLCSVCNQVLDLLPKYLQGDQFDVEWDLSLVKYCPRCGAKMDLKEEGND